MSIRGNKEKLYYRKYINNAKLEKENKPDACPLVWKSFSWLFRVVVKIIEMVQIYKLTRHY